MSSHTLVPGGGMATSRPSRVRAVVRVLGCAGLTIALVIGTKAPTALAAPAHTKARHVTSVAASAHTRAREVTRTAASGHAKTPKTKKSPKSSKSPKSPKSAKAPKSPRSPQAPEAVTTHASIVQTTRDLRYALTSMPQKAFSSSPASGAPVITVNDAAHFQTMTGFGGAMTDTSAWLLDTQLSPSQRAQAMTDLFSSAGIDINYVRIPMGGSDFTVQEHGYTYDDIPAGQTDPTMADFSIAHDTAYIIPALQQMLQTNPAITTFANPWTAPPWMKANDADDDLNDQGVFNSTDNQALATYFVMFLQAYAASGVPVDDITPMNEPTSDAPFPSTYFLSAEPTFVTNYLKPALAAADLNPGIYGLDGGTLADAETLMSSPAAADLAGIAFHCYGGMGDFTALHDLYPAENIILNECSPGIIPYSPSEVVIDAADNWASAVQLWNLALDPQGGPVQTPNYGCGGCTGIITVNPATRTFTLNRNYYEFGQASRYIHRGAVRIQATRLVSDIQRPACCGVTLGVDDAAFLNPDGSKVLLAYNSAASPETISIAWHNKYLTYTIPSDGTDTFTWK